MANISCDDLDFVCEECYQVLYDDCEAILVELGLTALTSYCVKFYDKFGNTFNQTVTTNASGSFTIDQSALPDNFFNPYSGKIELQIFANCDTDTRVSFTIAYIAFNCLLLVNYESEEADEDLSVSGSSYVAITDGDDTVYIRCGETYECMNGASCEDGSAVLKDSSSATISTTPIPSGDTVNITAPDGVASNSNATYSLNVKSNGTAAIPNTTVNVYIDGVLNQSTSIVTLDPAATINISL